MKEFNIDLRWSLWSAGVEEVTECAPEAIAAARLAFEGNLDKVVIHTAPKKEIRFGNVTFTEGCAEVHFWFEWDEPYEQLYRIEEKTGELSEQEEKSMREQVELFFSESLEHSESAELTAPSFEELMKEIDEVESRLLSSEDAQSKHFEEFLGSLADWVLEERNNPITRPFGQSEEQ